METQLDTVEAVIAALGGNGPVAELLGISEQAVSNWKSRGAIPAEWFLRFDEALTARGMRADRSVFRFVRTEAA